MLDKFLILALALCAVWLIVQVIKSVRRDHAYQREAATTTAALRARLAAKQARQPAKLCIHCSNEIRAKGADNYFPSLCAECSQATVRSLKK